MATKIQKKLNWTRTAIKIFWNCFCLLHSRRSARGSISKASVTVYRQGNTMTSGWKPSDPRVQVSGVLNPSAFLCVPNEVYSNEVMSVLWLCVFPPSSPVLVAFQLPYPHLQRPSEQQSQLARVILFLLQGFRGKGASSAQSAIGISLISQISTEPPSRLTAAAHCWYPLDADFLIVNRESSVYRFDLKTAGTKASYLKD